MNKSNTAPVKGQQQNFKHRVLSHLADYRTTLVGSEQGFYNNKKYEHILPEADKMKNIIDKGYADEIKAASEKIKLHQYFAHLNSSQALALNLFGPLREENRLGEVLRFVGIDYRNQDIESHFEYLPDLKEQTEFDFHIKAGAVEVFCEVKYTEETLRTKSQSTRDDERWGKHYQADMEKILCQEHQERAKEIFFNSYQLWRNIRMVAHDDTYVCFVIPSERKDLEAEIYLAKTLLTSDYADKIKVLHIDCFGEKMANDDNRKLAEHYSEFMNKYFRL